MELLWPVWDTKAPIMQRYGDNTRAYRPYGQEGHNGVDIGVVEGTGVLASLDAKVRFVGDGFDHPIMGSAAGLCVVLETRWYIVGYAHLSHVYVKEGDRVKAGDVLALSGKTGAVTGPHLHWELLKKPLKLGNGYLGRVDPLPYLKTPLPCAVDGAPAGATPAVVETGRG